MQATRGLTTQRLVTKPDERESKKKTKQRNPKLRTNREQQLEQQLEHGEYVRRK